jgi:DNA-directed RNA polymerase subunit K/omega
MTKKKVTAQQDGVASDNDEYEIEDIPENLDDDVLDENDDDTSEGDDDSIDDDNILNDGDTKGCGIDDEEYYNQFETEMPVETPSEYVSVENRISCNRLTRYEMVRILGERTKQLTMGAKPLIKNFEKLSYDKIAEEELKLNMVPFKIKRPLPNGKFEIWTLEELNKEHLYYLLD